MLYFENIYYKQEIKRTGRKKQRDSEVLGHLPHRTLAQHYPLQMILKNARKKKITMRF